MKSVLKTMSMLVSLCGVSVLCAQTKTEDVSSRYSYNATRGAWPVSTTPEEQATPRYIETPLELSDLKTLNEMKIAIADENQPAKYMAVLFTGWDWCESGSRLLVEWRKGIGEQFITTVYDWPERDYTLPESAGENAGLNISERSRHNSYAGSLYHWGSSSNRAHVWPAIALYDGEGKLFALERGVEYMNQAALKALVAEKAANYEAYLTKKNAIDAVTEASLTTAATNGDMGMRVDGDVVKDEGGRTITLDIYKAALLANALIELEDNAYKLAFFNIAGARAADFNQIATWDPQDVSGALRRVKNDDLFSTAGTFRVALTDERKAALADLIDNTRLVKYSDNEYQQALLCGFNLYKQNGDMTTAEVYARRAIDVNPASFWGEGARGQLLMRNIGPVTLGFGWNGYHFTSPSAKVAADGTATITADTIKVQDGIERSGTQNFKWTMRYGNDFYFRHQGWYNFRMQATSGNPLAIYSVKIYIGTANLDDPTQGTLIFDGSQAVANNFMPSNGDDMATFSPVSFPKGLMGNQILNFNFYMPRGAQKLFPIWEKDWSGKPKYNDVAIVIEGKIEGSSSLGSFSVNPVQTATAQTAPNTTEILVDGVSTSIGDIFDAQRDIVDGKMPGETVDGEAVADAVEALLTGETPDADFIKALTRATLFYEYESNKGYAGKISEVAAKDKYGVNVLNALMKDQAWLTSLLTSGPIVEFAPNSGGSRGKPGDMLHRLALLWRMDTIYTTTNLTTRRGTITADEGQVGYDPVLRRMAAVGAINGAPFENGNLGYTHLLYRDLMDRGILHGDFYTQSVAQMRYALNPQCFHVLDIEHAITTSRTRIDWTGDAAWQMYYNLENFFGDSIFGSDYFKAWERTVLPGRACGREIGAVCGGISHYLVLAANATGRRAITGGQPGHCAATHRSFDGSFWELDYNVGAPTGNHFPLWQNYTYYVQEFYDDMWDDPRTLVGYRLMWAARLRALKYGEKDPGVEALYHRAITYAPLCYQAILEYRDYLTANYPKDADRWLVWSEAVTNGLWRYPVVGWPLLNNNLPAPIKARYGEEGALAVFKQLHARMHNSNRKTRETYNYVEYVLTPQAELFDETHMISLVATALDARYGTSLFNNLINWGNSYYASGTPAYTTYQTMLQSVYMANGNPLGVKATCLEALLDASKMGNVSAFNEMSSLYVNLFEDATYPEVSNEAPLYDYPMVSADGLITLSSYPTLNTSGSADELHASAQAYCHAKSVINHAAFGTYSVWTQPQTDDPWVMVQLPGEASIYGVVIQNAEGRVPLTVEISADAQSWTTLVAGRSVGAGEILNVPFNGSLNSRYVRVRYPNMTGGELSLKLNKIQVFAKKLY